MKNIGFWHYNIETEHLYVCDRLTETLNLGMFTRVTDIFERVIARHRFRLLRQIAKIIANNENNPVEDVLLFRASNLTNSELHAHSTIRLVNRDNNKSHIEGVLRFHQSPGLDLPAETVAALVYKYTSEGVLVTDEDGYILDVNEGFCKITGYRPEEVIGKRTSILKSGNQTTEFYASMWQSLTQKGKWRGQLWNKCKDSSQYVSFQNITRVERPYQQPCYVSVFSDITSEYKHQSELRQMAYHDRLTGLKNMNFLKAHITQAISQAPDDSFHLLFIDMNDFKQINDTYGHAYGDEILRKIAERLKNSTEPYGEIARFGGDEFIVFAKQLNAKQLHQMLRHIKVGLKEPLKYKQQHHQFSASIGISEYPINGSTYDELLNASDLAMYSAKQTRLRECNYNEEMGYLASRRSRLAKDFLTGLRTGQFHLVYQPQFCMQTREVIGYEALSRWQHHELGNVSPVEFVDVAANNDYANELSEWVVRTALNAFKKSLNENPKLSISINVSACELMDECFGSYLQQACCVSDVDPKQVVLEITESEIVEDICVTTEVLKRLRNFGIRIAIDDFGKGYSSFYYLRKLPVDIIKVDKACIEDAKLDGQTVKSIITAIVNLTNTLNLTLLVEGVESHEQCLLLEQTDVEYVQGYHFARPQCAEFWLQPPLSRR